MITQTFFRGFCLSLGKAGGCFNDDDNDDDDQDGDDVYNDAGEDGKRDEAEWSRTNGRWNWRRWASTCARAMNLSAATLMRSGRWDEWLTMAMSMVLVK